MKSFARFSMLLLLGVNAIEDNTETALRVLRGQGWGGGKGGDADGSRQHEGGHHGHDGNHTWGNHTYDRTEWLNQTCIDNGIVCSNVSADVLANCTNFTDYGHHGDDWDRDLLVVVDEAQSIEDEDAEILEQEQLGEYSSAELRGSVKNLEARDLKRRHGNEGRHQGNRNQDGSRWGNLTDTELEAMRLNHLTCRCCMN